MHFDLVSITAVGGESYDVTLSATSRRFSGTGTMRVSLQENLIAHLIIS
ncbi:hypothetical protein [Agromyces albus]|nr:hypothetical protein [Agromyces albus]MDQ0577715.1 hypothetical protein [Agromyces albus]